MRKHLYLVTEHEDDRIHGSVQSTDMRLDYPNKNKEGDYTVFNEDDGEFRTVGKKVGLGYHDFESRDDFEDRAAEVMQAKVREVDRRWAEKAGIAETVYEDGESA